jgi:gluconolactonase
MAERGTVGMPDNVTIIQAEIWSKLPDRLRLTDRRSAWVDANKPGATAHSFLEGPAFAPDGSVWLVDIPYGRIFQVDANGEWSVCAEYDGWPNGMRLRPDGSFILADYRRGILRFDPKSGNIVPIFETYRSESFKGCNDLWFAQDGSLFFTDQGQTGMHDPTGRVFRANPALDSLEPLIRNGPSPNGLVTDLADKVLFVAMTRACEVWRLPLFPDGTSKVGIFARLPAGVSGPDGMALDCDGNLYVCHASRGAVFIYNQIGDQIALINCSHIGMAVTNLVFGGTDHAELFITISDAGVVAKACGLAKGRSR